MTSSVEKRNLLLVTAIPAHSSIVTLFSTVRQTPSSSFATPIHDCEQRESKGLM